MSDIEYNARQKFQDRVTKGMLGPGSDTWGVSESEEIISDYPLIRYFTGVLFPEKAIISSLSLSVYSDEKADKSVPYNNFIQNFY